MRWVRMKLVYTFGLAAILLMLSLSANAQGKLAQRMKFQARVMGQGSQFGQTFNIWIYIEACSTAADQEILLDALKKDGQEGVVRALSKMSSKGRITLTTTTGYQIVYVREFKTATGTKLRLVTNRPIGFGEAVANTRSSDYNISALELNLSTDKKNGTGTFLPAFQFLVKNGQLEIEARLNPWKIVDIYDWSHK